MNTMNGIGVGIAVGFGTIIGLGIVAPSADVTEYMATFVFYGFMSGLAFHMWKLALGGWKPPFLNRR